jgi:hypothetical protein
MVSGGAGGPTSVGHLGRDLEEIMVPDISELLRHGGWCVAPTAEEEC